MEIRTKQEAITFIKDEYPSFFILEEDNQPMELYYKTSEDIEKNRNLRKVMTRVKNGINIMQNQLQSQVINPLVTITPDMIVDNLPHLYKQDYELFKQRERRIHDHKALIEGLKEVPYADGQYVVSFPARDMYGMKMTGKYDYGLFLTDTGALANVADDSVFTEEQKKFAPVLHVAGEARVKKALQDDFKNEYEHDYKKFVEIFKNIPVIDEELV